MRNVNPGLCAVEACGLTHHTGLKGRRAEGQKGRPITGLVREPLRIVGSGHGTEEEVGQKGAGSTQRQGLPGYQAQVLSSTNPLKLSLRTLYEGGYSWSRRTNRLEKKKKMLMCTAEFTKGKYRQYSRSHFLKTYLPSIWHSYTPPGNRLPVASRTLYSLGPSSSMAAASPSPQLVLWTKKGSRPDKSRRPHGRLTSPVMEGHHAGWSDCKFPTGQAASQFLTGWVAASQAHSSFSKSQS